MELTDPIPSEPITLNGVPQFCEEGNRLALDYLKAARDLLRKCGAMPNESAIKYSAIPALENFRSHAQSCEFCG